MRRTGSLAIVAAGIAFLTGCQSSLTGNEGNFTFSYDADDRVTDFNKPIAVGARLDIDVRDAGLGLPVTLSSAQSDDVSVLSVVDFAGSSLTVQGEGEGNVLLSVEGATSSGESLPDSVNLLVRVPEVLKLSHTCAPGGEARYLTGQRIWVPFELEMSNTQPVIGYGYYPVSLSSPAASLDVAASGSQYMALDTASAPGSATIASEIDSSSLLIGVVAPEEIDGVAPPIAWVLEDIDVGDTNAFYVLPESGGLPICQADVAKVVTSETPEICSIRDRAAPEDSFEFGWFDVTGLSEGTCRFTVRYPSSGASEQFSYPIEP